MASIALLTGIAVARCARKQKRAVDEKLQEALMRIGEYVLEKLSRDPAAADLNKHVNDWNESTCFELLDEFIPDFRSRIQGNSFVDFGCGKGEQSIALVRAGAKSVLGIDINTASLEQARQRVGEQGLSEIVTFVEELPEEKAGLFDYVISQNSMEHFQDPGAVLNQMASALKPGGRLLITFGPPWLAPYGSHMHFFTRVPWVNVWFSERTVMAVRSRYRDDGARRYEDVQFGLNKMTVRKFEQIVERSALEAEYLYYRGIKNLDWLTRLPLVREFCTNHITAILRKFEKGARNG